MAAFSIRTTAAPSALGTGQALSLAQEVKRGQVLISTPTRALGWWPSRVWCTAERLKRVKHRLATSLLVVAALVVSTFAALSGTTPAAAAPSGPRWPIKGAEPRDSDNVILKWDEKLLQAIRAYPAQTGPTIAARALGVSRYTIYNYLNE